jgi:hypothetical protein
MTTYPTSTAPAAKAWLFGQLQTTLTAASDATFSCTYATEVDTLAGAGDQVWMGGIVNRNVTVLALLGDMGAGSLKEEYNLEVNVSCYRRSDKGDTAETRAWDLAGQIETVARTDPTLGGNVTISRPAQSNSTVDWDDAGTGRICTLTLNIYCLAQL